MAAKRLRSEAAKKKAFTLAEVLITLAIIGVVAALTIPTVVAKYQKQQYYTQFMKMYNTLSNAFQMVEQDYGNTKNWGITGSTQENTDRVISILKEYIKVGSEPTSLDNVSDIKPLGYEEAMMSYSDLFDEGAHFFLPDGSMIFSGDAEVDAISFVVDCNGVKGPNILGRDVFGFMYTNSKGLSSLDENLSHCNSDNPGSSESSGMSCAYRLMTEGKMDY